MPITIMPERDSSGKSYTYLAPFASTGDFRFRGKGMAGTANFNSVTNIDYELTEERFLNGCHLILKNQVFGDSVKFQVVHPIAGVLDEFGTDWYVSEDSQDQGQILLPYPAKIPAGLIIRLVYTSVGTVNNVLVKCNLFLHMKAT